MEDSEKVYLSAVERELKKRFDKSEADKRRLPSTAADARSSGRVDSLVLPDEMRAKMPLTKDKYIVRENPRLVEWERETRKFLRNLSPEHGHRVSAVHVFEWATGLSVKDLMEQQKQAEPGKESWRTDLRKINQVLGFYFGKPYTTWIAGKKIGKAYKVRPGYYIRRHRPLTLTLYAEYIEGTLYP